MTGNARWLFQLTKPLWIKILLSIVFFSLGGISASLDPLLLRRLIDLALPEKMTRAAIVLVFGIGSCYLIRTLSYSFGGLLSFAVAKQSTDYLRSQLIFHFSKLSLDFHEAIPTGEKLACIEYDVNEIANLGPETANFITRAILLFVINFFIMLRLSASLTLIVIPMIFGFVFIQKKFRPIIKSKAERSRMQVGLTTSILAEHLGSIPQLQLLLAEMPSIRQSRRAWMQMLDAQWSQRCTEAWFNIATSCAFIAVILAILSFGSWQVIKSELTIGTLVAIYAYASRVFDPVSTAMDLYTKIQRVGVSIERIREMLELNPSIRDSGTLTLTEEILQNGLSLQNVTFSYENRRIIDDISLDLMPAKRIAIIGSSGSGKSTLTRLLVRMIDPQKGKIVLSDNSLQSYTLQSLRETICLVPQSPILFSGTIRENLLYGKQTASDAELWTALELSQLKDTIENLEYGLDTKLGHLGNTFSGGERQRMAIARALLRNSSMLILDEATSALDVLTESRLLRSIADFIYPTPMVIVTHRLSSVSWVDNFILMRAGRIAEMGSHTVLYRTSSLYRSLYAQSSD